MPIEFPGNRELAEQGSALVQGCAPSFRRSALAGVAALGVLFAGVTGAHAQLTSRDSLLPDARSFPVVPDPGQVLVRLGGHINWYAAAMFDSGNQANGAAVPAGAGRAKQAPYGFGDYVHLNPSADGIAANGLRYGFFVDIWQEKPGVSAAGVGGIGAAGYSGGGSGGSITGADRSLGVPYIRRQWLYLGTPQLGQVRVGSGDSVGGIYQTGTFENFNDGGFNGDIAAMYSGNVSPTWPFDLVGNLYTPTKITYLSPIFAGFEAGITYEPNTNAMSIFDGCGTAGTTCARLSSSNNVADAQRRENMVNAEARYRGTFGPVATAVELGYFGSGVVANTNPAHIKYSGFNQGVLGATVAIGGFTVGGHMMYGKFSGQWSLEPAAAPASMAFDVGASYTVGPVIVGVQALNYWNAGNSYSGVVGGPNTEMNERGIAAGGTYSLVPGVSLFLNYLYGERHEAGYDLLNGGASKINNTVKMQGLGIGTQLRW